MSHLLNIGGLGTSRGGPTFKMHSIGGSDFQNGFNGGGSNIQNGFFLGADFEIYIFACKNAGLN